MKIIVSWWFLTIIPVILLAWLLIQWWFIAVALVALVIWIILEVVALLCFQWYMHKIEFPTTQRLRHRPYALGATLYELFNAQMIGFVWFLHWRQWIVAGIALFILVAGIVRAVTTKDATEFARSGALIVITGFISLVLGNYEKRKSKRYWHSIDQSQEDPHLEKKLEDFSNEEIENGEKLSLRVTVYVSIIGTLIWAYGDQIMSCEIFSIFSILPDPDNNITCTKHNLW